MAYPIILVNSATGSDTLSSGAGPAVALNGTNASTDGTGLIVTLDGSPDLTDVLTDGSHVLYLAIATVGVRNFTRILGKDNVAKTVTVDAAYSLGVSGLSWAIGGKRASIGNTNTRKLYEKNAGPGDVDGNWIIEMESGHTETLSAEIRVRSRGDELTGRFVTRGTRNAAVMPILTLSTNAVLFSLNNVGLEFSDFEVRNTSGVKTSCQAFSGNTVGRALIHRIKCDHPTQTWLSFFNQGSSTSVIIENCSIAYCAGYGIQVGSNGNASIRSNTFSKINGDACRLTGTSIPIHITNNLIYNNSGNGIVFTFGISSANTQAITIENNTIHNNTYSGIEFAANSGQNSVYHGTILQNNNITQNGRWGISWSGSGITTTMLEFYRFRNLHNNFGTGITANVLGNHGHINPPSEGECNYNPGYIDAANGNFMTDRLNLGSGWPSANRGFGFSETRTYEDIGASQYRLDSLPQFLVLYNPPS